MIISIDFNSEEAIYIQLRNQIIMGIANEEIARGENLPSVRELADHIGINMHTVNKAYTILKQEGYVQVDRRRGAVISVSEDKLRATKELMNTMRILLAQAVCKNITKEEVHDIVDRIYSDYNS